MGPTINIRRRMGPTRMEDRHVTCGMPPGFILVHAILCPYVSVLQNDSPIPKHPYLGVVYIMDHFGGSCPMLDDLFSMVTLTWSDLWKTSNVLSLWAPNYTDYGI